MQKTNTDVNKYTFSQETHRPN